jgi:SAM-dependent methyltransferase
VGSTGRVVATELDPRFLDGHGRANLEVRKHDIVTDPLEEAAFDLACARTVLEWIPDRQRALERMVSAVRPGGWVVVEDHDIGGIMAQALAHYTDPPEHAPLYERIVRAMEAAAHDLMPSVDPSFGGRLAGVLADAGLVNIGAEVHASLVAGGTSGLLPSAVELFADRMPGTRLVTASDIQSFLALTADPSFRYAPTLLVTAWGQRPA